MIYPLKGRHLLLREMWCSVVGHKWKSSWRHRSNYAELSKFSHEEEKEKVPYSQRHSGNLYYEYSAGWQYKCRRCRKYSGRYDLPLEFIRHQLWNGIRQSWRKFKMFKSSYKDTQLDTGRHGVFFILTMMFIHFIGILGTFMMYQNWMWPQLSYWIFDITDWMWHRIYND